jgi:zinc protease
MAASYSSFVDKEMTVIAGTVHQDHLEAYYNLFRDAILSPAFKEDDYSRLKTDQLNSVTRTLRYNNDEELGKEVLSQAIFKDHPYGNPVAGTATSIASLTLQDVKDFYASQYTKMNVVLGLAGNFPDSLVAQVKKDFGSLPEGKISNAEKSIPAASDLKGLQAVLIEKETPATAISFGFPVSFTRSSDDFYPLLVMNCWLGQHRNSFGRLYQVMREIRGLNYGDYTYIEYWPFGSITMQPLPNFARHRQIFQVWIRPVQNQNRHFALRQAIRELQNLIDNGMTKEDFERARNFLQNYTVNLAQSNSEQLGYALDDRFYNLQPSFLDELRSRLSTMKLEDVNAAIKKHLSTRNMIIAAVTSDAEGFKKDLAANRPSPITYESPKPEVVLEEDKQIISYPIEIQAERIAVIPVEKVFQ